MILRNVHVTVACLGYCLTQPNLTVQDLKIMVLVVSNLVRVVLILGKRVEKVSLGMFLVFQLSE